MNTANKDCTVACFHLHRTRKCKAIYGDRKQIRGAFQRHRRKLLETTDVSTLLIAVMILWVNTYTSIKTCGIVQFKRGSLLYVDYTS